MLRAAAAAAAAALLRAMCVLLPRCSLEIQEESAGARRSHESRMIHAHEMKKVTSSTIYSVCMFVSFGNPCNSECVSGP